MSHFNSRGFTLIELMIVMFIMALTVSLVVPNVGTQLNRAEYNADRQKLENLVEFARAKSFFDASVFYIEASEHELQIFDSDDAEQRQLLKHAQFEHIRFPFLQTLRVENTAKSTSAFSLVVVDRKGSQTEVAL